MINKKSGLFFYFKKVTLTNIKPNIQCRILSRLNIHKFDERGTLNFDMLTYLLKSKSEHLEVMVKQLKTEKWMLTREFIIGFLEEASDNIKSKSTVFLYAN